MEYDYIDDKTDDEHKPLVVDKTLKKEYLNIKEDNIINIISGLKRVVKHKSYKGFVVLLNGESGVGKSKLAEIIAKELNFTIRKISCGDILSKYVGEAEANVKSVISNNDSKSVLLLDEVDGMLPDRENSQMQYEKSLTSEWLSQLDNPVGIIILTTNYKRALDKALLRRINLKLTLEDLSNDTIPKILRSKVKEFDLKRDVNINNISDGLNGLRIGDVGVVDKLVIYNGINTLSKYIDRLKSEIKERTPNNKNKVGLL
jgi:SpoVK/Ycf46/Vps4 family AAA+-type ATPase